MRISQFWPSVALVLWTLFVWGSRIRNILADGDLTSSGRISRVALALSFVVIALVVAALLVATNRVRGADANRLRLSVGVLAVYGIVVWVVRGLGISFADHSTQFKVVHLVLAGITVGLGLLALRKLPLGPSG